MVVVVGGSVVVVGGSVVVVLGGSVVVVGGSVVVVLGGSVVVVVGCVVVVVVVVVGRGRVVGGVVGSVVGGVVVWGAVVVGWGLVVAVGTLDLGGVVGSVVVVVVPGGGRKPDTEPLPLAPANGLVVPGVGTPDVVVVLDVDDVGPDDVAVVGWTGGAANSIGVKTGLTLGWSPPGGASVFTVVSDRARWTLSLPLFALGRPSPATPAANSTAAMPMAHIARRRTRGSLTPEPRGQTRRGCPSPRGPSRSGGSCSGPGSSIIANPSHHSGDAPVPGSRPRPPFPDQYSNTVEANVPPRLAVSAAKARTPPERGRASPRRVMRGQLPHAGYSVPWLDETETDGVPTTFASTTHCPQRPWSSADAVHVPRLVTMEMVLLGVAVP
jgi:hypothetical protein